MRKINLILATLLLLSLVWASPAYNINYTRLATLDTSTDLDALTLTSNTKYLLTTGTYNIDAAITISSSLSNVVFEGSGINTIINKTTSGGKIFDIAGTTSDAVEGIEIRNMKLGSSHATKPTEAISISACQDCIVEHVDIRIASTNVGILLITECIRTRVSNNYIEINEGRGIYIQGGGVSGEVAFDNIIENNNIYSIAASSYLIELWEQVEKTTIKGNHLKATSTSQGIAVMAWADGGDPAYNIIYGNIVEVGANSGINIEGSDYNVVTGNFVTGAATGINMSAGGSDNANYNTVSGNVVRNSTTGIIIVGNYNNVSGNIIVGGTTGISCSGSSSYWSITGNFVQGASTRNIYINNCGNGNINGNTVDNSASANEIEVVGSENIVTDNSAIAGTIDTASCTDCIIADNNI